jgi:hypothetical protein
MTACDVQSQNCTLHNPIGEQASHMLYLEKKQNQLSTLIGVFSEAGEF